MSLRRYSSNLLRTCVKFVAKLMGIFSPIREKMAQQLVGVIQRQGFGFGVWALVTEDGQTYELKNAPEEIRQAYIKVKITGTVRKDLVTLAMIGPVLEVESYVVLQ